MRRHAMLWCGVLAACSSSDSTSPGSGRLTVTITPPAGATPSVVITGPGSFSKTVTSTTTLTGLTPGSYTIAPATVYGRDSIVPPAYVGTATGSPATVAAGGSVSAAVTYAVRSGSGAVWVVGAYPFTNDMTANGAQAYSAAELLVTGAPTPVTALSTTTTAGANTDASGVAFDTAGNLWIANQNSGTVIEYTSAQLAPTGNGSGSTQPAVTISIPSDSAVSDSAGPIALAFDAHHNLWVVNQWAGTIIELTSAQLVSGTAAPTVTIHDGPAEHTYTYTGNNPLGLAFDGAGNLWVANQGTSIGQTGTVTEYSASQLTSSGTPNPAVTLTPVLSTTYNDSTIVVPTGLVFDRQGNLWVAGKGIYEIAASALTTSGSVTPVRWFTPPHGPHGFYDWNTDVVFDNSGNIWFAGFEYGIIGEYTAAQIAAGGDPAPAVEITLSGKFAPVRLAFDR